MKTIIIFLRVKTAHYQHGLAVFVCVYERKSWAITTLFCGSTFIFKVLLGGLSNACMGVERPFIALKKGMKELVYRKFCPMRWLMEIFRLLGAFLFVGLH